MEQNNFEKKLEEISLPKIEIPSHRKELRRILLEKYYKEKRSWELLDVFKKIIPVGAIAIILGILLIHNLPLATYNLAQTREIAVNDYRVQALIEKGATIQDVKIADSKGYVLLQTQPEIDKAEMEVAAGKKLSLEEEAIGALAEIDLKNKKVSGIRKLEFESYPLAEETKAKAREIAEKDPVIQQVIPKEAQITKIVPISLPRLKLITEENLVRAIPEPAEELEAKIIYELNSDQWESRINLKTEKVEEVNFLSEKKE